MAGDLGKDVGRPRGDADGDGVCVSRTGTWDEELSEDVGGRGVQGRGVAELLAAVSRTARHGSREWGALSSPSLLAVRQLFFSPSEPAYAGRRIKGQRQGEQGREDVDMEDVLDGFQQKARDHARIPMQASSVQFFNPVIASYYVVVQV